VPLTEEDDVDRMALTPCPCWRRPGMVRSGYDWPSARLAPAAVSPQAATGGPRGQGALHFMLGALAVLIV
jgi:hypothetical protein